jgi:hypothetical protein
MKANVWKAVLAAWYVCVIEVTIIFGYKKIQTFKMKKNITNIKKSKM